LGGGAGTGALNLPTGTTGSSGIAFGTDTSLYRSAAGSLETPGKLGVGTAPGALLHVYGGTYASQAWIQATNGLGLSLNADYPGFGLNAEYNGTNWVSMGPGYTGNYTMTPTTGQSVFNTGTYATAGGQPTTLSTAMSISNNGEVEVGTLSPGAQLEIDANSASTIAQIVSNPAASPTADLTDWKANGSTVASVDHAGNFSAASLSGAGTGLTGTAPSFNIGGNAGNLSGTPALPNGTMGTTQTVGDNTTKLATDAFVLANAGGSGSAQTNFATNGQIITSTSATAITGLVTPTIPVSTTRRYSCEIYWSQNTAIATVTFGAAFSATTSVANIVSMTGNVGSTTTSVTVETALTPIQALLTLTPLTTTNYYHAHLDGVTQTNASYAVSLQIYGWTSNVSDALVIQANSNCGLLP
jgi:hypothetical protein